MENVNKDDKMTINYKNNELTFIGLKEALKEYNEQNINTIMSNIIFILEKQSINENISTEDYFKLWTSQYEILNQDYGFSTKDNNTNCKYFQIVSLIESEISSNFHIFLKSISGKNSVFTSLSFIISSFLYKISKKRSGYTPLQCSKIKFVFNTSFS